MTKHQWIAAEGVQKGSLYRGSDVRCEDECGVEKQFWDGSHLRLVFRPIVEWTCMQIHGLAKEGSETRINSGE